MTINNIIDTIRLELNNTRHSLTPWFHEDDRILRYQPSDGGWSGIQILEHIMLTSHFLLLIIGKAATKAKQRAASTSISQDWNTYELKPTQIEAIGIHKSFAWSRPDHMEPTGNVALNEIESGIIQQFNRCDEHLTHLSNGEGVLCKVTMTVNGIGKMDVYQYIYFLILHAKRHLTQLDENKNELTTGRG